jgi:hypothetical protein
MKETHDVTKAEPPHKEKKKGYFPSTSIILSFLLIGTALTDLYTKIEMPRKYLSIIILVAGAWLLLLQIGRIVYFARKKRLMRYI